MYANAKLSGIKEIRIHWAIPVPVSLLTILLQFPGDSGKPIVRLEEVTHGSAQSARHAGMGIQEPGAYVKQSDGAHL